MDNASSQKKIAKTAIRHIRGNLTSIIKLIKITREKVELVSDPLTNQYLKEIQNHLEMIYYGIKNTEADFNEIVNEELIEQNTLEIEISEILEELTQKNQELILKEQEQVSDKETINSLKQTIKDKEIELSKKVSTLPFGMDPYLSGSKNYLIQNNKNAPSYLRDYLNQNKKEYFSVFNLDDDKSKS